MSAASNSGFAGTVSLSCGNAPTKATCSANPANVTLTSNGNATFTVSVTTTANSFMTYDMTAGSGRLYEGRGPDCCMAWHC